MSEKTPNNLSSSAGVEVLSVQEREKLSQRCVSQKFQESLIFFKGVEAHNTIDAQYNQLANAQSRVRRNPAVASSSGSLARDSIPNTRETMNSKEARENSGGSKVAQTGQRKTSGSINNSRPGSNSSSFIHANNQRPPENNSLNQPKEKDPVQRTNSTKELHDVYEELNRLKAVVEKLTIENKELLTENSLLRKENRELKTQKTYFGSKPKDNNNLPSIELPPPRDSSGERTPSQPNSTNQVPNVKDDDAASRTEMTVDDETKDTTTTQEEPSHVDTTAGTSTTSTTTTTIATTSIKQNNKDNDTQKLDDGTIVILPPSADRKSTPSITLTSSEVEVSNVSATTSPYGTVRTRGEDGTEVVIPSSIENLTYKHATSSDQNLTSPTERQPKKERVPSNRQRHTSSKTDGHSSKSQNSSKLYVEKPSKSSRRSLQLDDSSSIVNSMGSSEKEKHLAKVLSAERPKDHGSVRKKGRPKSQDMSDLIAGDIQIERGACNTKGCNCSLYVHSESETCLRCSHALTGHALPDSDKVPKSPKKSSSSERREERKSVQLTESKKVATPQDSPVKPKVQITEPTKEIIKSDATVKEEEGTDFHGIGDDLAAKWVIPYSELVFVEKLGKGISSVVYTGKWKGKDVAIKVLRLETKFINDCKGELMIMSQIVSPYVVHFYGATLDTKLAVVMEICANGSLFHCLQNTTIPIFWKRVLNWSLQIVHGMNILHEWNPVILHRDMKSLNLLVDAEWNLKLCDFGLSRFNTEASQAQTLAKLRGTYTYTAPEMYFKNKYTTKSDVFSIGVIFWELVARLINGKYIRPYSEYKDINMDYQIIYRVATKGLRPTMPIGCPESYAALITRCLDNSPEIRPSCKELIEIINGLKKEFKKKKQKWKKSEFVEKKEVTKK